MWYSKSTKRNNNKFLGGFKVMNYKTTRANKMRSRNGRPTSGHCVECGRLTSEEMGGTRVTIPSQTNGVWVCEAHRGKKNLRGYHVENSNVVGTITADKITISVELESLGYSTHARAYLVKNQFIPTSDCTVDIEYKSPIYMSELPLAKIVGGIEYMDKNPNYKFSVNNNSCGIHTHYGFSDNRFDFTDLEYDYKELFYPLQYVVDLLTESSRIAIFGRDYQRYNRKCNFGYPNTHENWINIQHTNTLEIRMPKFIDADRYMRFLKCFKKIFKALNTHYIEKCLEHGYSFSYSNKEKRKAFAIKAGIKMAKIFVKEYREHYRLSDEDFERIFKSMKNYLTNGR